MIISKKRDFVSKLQDLSARSGKNIHFGGTDGEKIASRG